MRTASILIRTLDEAESLADTLDALFAQRVPPHEVIVIDSGSTDDTLAIAARYPVVILHIEPMEWSYPRALNLGAAHATGDFLVCLSAHCTPVGRDWLASLLRHFEDPEVAAVWGPSLRPFRPPPPPAGPQRQTYDSYTAETRMWGLSNANSALRRRLWLEVPFDERLPAAEDKAWARELMSRGNCIVFEPAAAVIHGRHHAGLAYRRNRAVMEGFRLMFPELDQPAAGSWRRAIRAGWGLIRSHASEPRPRQLLRDLGHGFSTLAAVIGGYKGSRRSTSGTVERDPPPSEP